MDKKIPDTVIGVLEQGKLTLDGVNISCNNMNPQNGFTVSVSTPVTYSSDIYKTLPVMVKEWPTPMQQLNDLKDFLKFKGIEIDKQELEDFIESRKLAEKMSHNQDEYSQSINFNVHEKFGTAAINMKSIAKVIL